MRRLAPQRGVSAGRYVRVISMCCPLLLLVYFVVMWSIKHDTERPTIAIKIVTDEPRIPAVKVETQPRDPRPSVDNNGIQDVGERAPKVDEVAHGPRAKPIQVPASIEYTLKQMNNVNMIKPRNERLKVIDGFTFNAELDLLEIRIMTLFDVVDWFVIVESDVTHQNTPKPLFFAQNRARFARYESKIIYYYVKDKPAKIETWTLEVHHRTAIGSRGIKQVMLEEKKIPLNDEDLIMITDMDEIPRPEVVNWLAWHSGYPSKVRFCMYWDLYGFMWRNPNTWCVRAIMPLSEVRKIKAEATDEYYATNKVRAQGANAPGEFVIGNPFGNQAPTAGWHCSWCFPVSWYINKLESSVHNEINQAHLKNYGWLFEQKRKGKWLLDGPKDNNIIRPAPRDADLAPAGWETFWNLGPRVDYLIEATKSGDEKP